MCNNCYHSKGRNKKAWKCSHTHKPHYALGVCQTCYQLKYANKTKKVEEDNKTNSSNHSISEEIERNLSSENDNNLYNKTSENKNMIKSDDEESSKKYENGNFYVNSIDNNINNNNNFDNENIDD